MLKSRVRRRAIRLVGATARRLIALPPVAGYFRSRANVVYHHGVWREGAIEQAMFGGVTLAQFCDDLTLLRRCFDFVPLSRLLGDGAEGASRKPELALTFDDGNDLYSSGAMDLLAEMGIAATIFVATNAVDNRALLWQHKLGCIRALRGEATYYRAFNDLVAKTGIGAPIDRVAEEGRIIGRWPAAVKDDYAETLWQACDMPPETEILEAHHPYFTWAQLAEACSAGHEVGLHTASHPYCGGLTAADIEAEFVAPAALLRQRLGIETLTFSYPFGRRLPQDLEAVARDRAGLACLLGSSGLSPKSTSPDRWRRVSLEKDIDHALFGGPIVNTLF